MVNPKDLQYLKQVSRVKHEILGKYLSLWTTVLGSAYRRLAYMDCFAGGGAYSDERGELLPGSPVIALRQAKDFVESRPGHSLVLWFVERNHRTAERLRTMLQSEGTVPRSVEYVVQEEDAQGFVERLISAVKSWGPGRQLIPTFCFVDPWGHPITIPVIRDLLRLGKVEILVNVMWFRISMNLNNPKAKAKVDTLFGHTAWQAQGFMGLRGIARERAFIDYLASEVGAKYHFGFPVRFSPEDRVHAGGRRTKFYLMHFSNHPKAVLLMKEVMWGTSDDLTELQFTGRRDEKQLKLWAEPDLMKLRSDLLDRFRATEEEFDSIRLKTLDWPFMEKHYRQVLKALEKEGVVGIRRIRSARSGLQGTDIVVFP